MEKIGQFVKTRRQKLGLTQEQIAEVSGVGIRFIRDLEQETKGSFRLDKVNQVLTLFGYQLGPIPKPKKGE